MINSGNELSNRQAEINKVLYYTFFLNLMVAVLKIAVGFEFNFLSLISAGIDSTFDGLSNILALVAIHFAHRPADKEHTYGHYKYETIGSLIISVLLIFSAFQVISNLISYFSGDYSKSEFGIIPLICVFISMITSGYVSYYERKKGEELKSSILTADSEHTYGDFIISFGVLFSIICSYYNILWPDFVIGSLICIYLFYLAYKIIKNSLPELLDASPDISKDVHEVVLNINEVKELHRLRARGNDNFVYIDFHLLLNGNLSLRDAHDIAHKVEDEVVNKLSQKYNHVDVIIHVEPYECDHMD